MIVATNFSTNNYPKGIFNVEKEKKKEFITSYLKAEKYRESRIFSFLTKFYVKRIIKSIDKAIESGTLYLSIIPNMPVEYAKDQYNSHVKNNIHRLAIFADEALQSVDYFGSEELKNRSLVFTKLSEDIMENLDVASDAELLQCIDNALSDIDTGNTHNNKSWEEMKAELLN